MAKRKRIGILTSGGDCAGLNAVIRAAVFRGIHAYGWDMVGIREGPVGLMKSPPDVVRFTLDMFDGDYLRQGGTLIRTTNRGDPFRYPLPGGGVADRSKEVCAGYRKLGLDGLIAIGGDGSLRIMSRLAAEGGLDVVYIPKTIDNDVPGTENSVGFITAVNIATEALDRLQTTAASHSRVMILEVMGRDCGHIALAAGIAGGADIILIPEIPFSIDALTRKIKDVRDSWKRNFALVVVAEGCRMEDGAGVTASETDGQPHYCGISHYLADKLGRSTGWTTRFTVLGHVQRGGAPATTDRVLASAFGVRAVDLIAEEKFGRLVVWRNRKVEDIAVEEAAGVTHGVDVAGPLVATARGLGISFGDE